jgi:hypothetical protein
VADRRFIEKTIKVWQPRTQKKLTSEDATAIIRNMTGFVELLLAWEKTENTRSEEGEINRGSIPQ